MAAGKSCLCMNREAELRVDCVFQSAFCILKSAIRLEDRINAVKQLAVSTGQLKALLLVHRRPIDPVVFREPSF